MGLLLGEVNVGLLPRSLSPSDRLLSRLSPTFASSTASLSHASSLLPLPPSRAPVFQSSFNNSLQTSLTSSAAIPSSISPTMSASSNSTIASNALCSLIEFSEQRFLSTNRTSSGRHSKQSYSPEVAETDNRSSSRTTHSARNRKSQAALDFKTKSNVQIKEESCSHFSHSCKSVNSTIKKELNESSLSPGSNSISPAHSPKQHPTLNIAISNNSTTTNTAITTTTTTNEALSSIKSELKFSVKSILASEELKSDQQQTEKMINFLNPDITGPIRPAAQYAISQLLRNSLANALLPAGLCGLSAFASTQLSPISSAKTPLFQSQLSAVTAAAAAALASGNNSLSPVVSGVVASVSANNNNIVSLLPPTCVTSAIETCSPTIVNASQHLQHHLGQQNSHIHQLPTGTLAHTTATPHSPATSHHPSSLLAHQSSSVMSLNNHHLASSHPLHSLTHHSQLSSLHYPLSTLAWIGSARGKPRKGMMRRAVFSDAQRQGLEKRFQVTKYINKGERKTLAEELGLKDSQVKIWFQNRRMKWRNSKERELLSHGGSREQTLPTKNNPNPDLTDVRAQMEGHGSPTPPKRRLRSPEMDEFGDDNEIDIEGYSDNESQASFDRIYENTSPVRTTHTLDSPS